MHPLAAGGAGVVDEVPKVSTNTIKWKLLSLRQPSMTNVPLAATNNNNSILSFIFSSFTIFIFNVR